MFPILYVLIKQNSNEKKHNKFLQKIAEEHRLKFDKTGTYGPLSLGLDTNNKKLVVVEFRGSADYDIFDLKDVKNVKITKKMLPAGYSASKKERIIYLSLDLENKYASKITGITFYDEEDEESIDADIRLNDAKIWDTLIHKNLAV
ncbi:hypothetical protein C7S20_06245 [Christiangramia fulva]|uniref:Uncharacterized protein n=2 Tax=Christiangramia fulva TaxID=2126553 RepID=A0A2R3Z3T9_9FLAO|nr:hypothetical protein C7S20_06245 [Christiangramia fulva]